MNQTIASLTDRNAKLIASLRETRDFIATLLATTELLEIQDLLTNCAEEVESRASIALGADAFEIGDNVLAESADLDLSEYQGVIVGKKLETNGSTLFTVEDRDGDCNDHEAHEIRLAD